MEARERRILHELAALPGVQVAEPFRMVPVRLRHGQRHERIAVTGLPHDGTLRRILDRDHGTMRPPEQGIVLSERLARDLAVGRGDWLTMEVLEGRRSVVRVPLSAVVEEYVGMPAYMDIATVNRMLREGPVISGADLQIDARAQPALLRAPEGPADRVRRPGAIRCVVHLSADSRGNHVHLTRLLCGLRGLIAFGVGYSNARIELSERGRELASLRVLGFTRAEVSAILLGELALLAVAALPLGCVMGYGLASAMVWLFDTDLFRLPLVVERSTYGLSVVVVVAAAATAALLVRRRVDRLDLIAVLKTQGVIGNAGAVEVSADLGCGGGSCRGRPRCRLLASCGAGRFGPGRARAADGHHRRGGADAGPGCLRRLRAAGRASAPSGDRGRRHGCGR